MNHSTLHRCALYLTLCGLLPLGGCAAFVRSSGPGPSPGTTRPAAVSVADGMDWHWSVTGDVAVRPEQVFAFGGRTYLQMRVGQIIPALVVNGTPVPFQLSPPYLIVTGEPATINLLARGYRAVVAHIGPVPGATQAPARNVQTIDATPTGAANAQGVTTFADPASSAVSDPTPTPHIAAPITDPVAAGWSVRPSDGLLSHALARWCRKAGMRLNWQSYVDLPITAPMHFDEPKLFEAMAVLLNEAGTAAHARFFYSVQGRTITVIAKGIQA
ncbi:MAG TPA: TcpQ domain-containing protein [Rhodanobacteraceae bacterium]